MARKKRASMREGPLADLFRSTDESVMPEEVKVTANGSGNAPVEVALEEPVQETPLPEPVPEPTPEPVPEPTPDPVPEPLPTPDPTPPEPVAEIDEPQGEITIEQAEVHHEGLERLMGGPGTDIRPAFGRGSMGCECRPNVASWSMATV